MKATAAANTVIFLDGPIGVGKTVLGRALAAHLGAEFVDRDDIPRPPGPWYGSVLSTCRALEQKVVAACEQQGLAVVAHPLRRREWVFYRERLRLAGIRLICVSLRATPEAILSEGRGRRLEPGEAARMKLMVAEGYGNRPFADAVVDTDRAPLAEATQALVRQVTAALARRSEMGVATDDRS